MKNISKNKMVLGMSCIMVVLLIAIGVLFINGYKEVNKKVNCYTIKNEGYDESLVNKVQEDRQYLISNKEELKQFSEKYNIALTEEVDSSLLEDNNFLVLITPDIDNQVNCKLSSLYVDDKGEPHMMIEKNDGEGETSLSWYFVAIVDKEYSKSLDLTRWQEFE